MIRLRAPSQRGEKRFRETPTVNDLFYLTPLLTTLMLFPAQVSAFAGYGRIPRIEGNPWVLVGQRQGTGLTKLDNYWYIIRKQDGLDDVRIHDLRHSCVTLRDFHVLKSLVSVCYYLYFSPSTQPA